MQENMNDRPCNQPMEHEDSLQVILDNMANKRAKKKKTIIKSVVIYE